MPVKITKESGGRYQVKTPNQVHAKGTTFEKAKAQERLLNAIEHNPDFVPRGSKKRGTYKRRS
jgi:hypothetical protein